MPAIAIDTPDGQMGVVSAQALLAQVAAGVQFVTVGVPPNAEGLVVVVPGLAIPSNLILAYGTVTGAYYTGAVSTSPTAPPTTTAFFDASSVTDDQVTVSVLQVPPVPWFVYADTGVHLMADISKAANRKGVQYVIPTAPALDTGDHPPVELIAAGLQFNANGNLLNAPPAGMRHRIFQLQAFVYTGTGYVVVVDGIAGTQLCFGGVGGMSDRAFLPSGLPLTIDAPLVVELSAAGGGAVVSVVYTTEQA
jgi:hypothetical protein